MTGTDAAEFVDPGPWVAGDLTAGETADALEERLADPDDVRLSVDCGERPPGPVAWTQGTPRGWQWR